MNSTYGLDPILTASFFTPVFYTCSGRRLPRLLRSFERRGEESLRGLVSSRPPLHHRGQSQLEFGVYYRLVQAGYIGSPSSRGRGDRLSPARAVPRRPRHDPGSHLSSAARFYGRAIMAVSQDRLGPPAHGANPVKIKTVAFRHRHRGGQSRGRGSSSPSRRSFPSMRPRHIGRMFAITVLACMGKHRGHPGGAVISVCREPHGATFYGPSCRSPCPSASCSVALAVRPAGCSDVECLSRPHALRGAGRGGGGVLHTRRCG